MNSLAHGTGAHLSDFGPAVRRYAWVSYRWALLNAAAVVIFLVGFRFYGAIGTIGVFIQVFFVTAGLLWIATQFYTWPFLLEQEDKRLRLALKNGLFLTLANPIYTLILLGMVAAGGCAQRSHDFADRGLRYQFYRPAGEPCRPRAPDHLRQAAHCVKRQPGRVC